ncbi:MAG: DEAD/DEAH box helicase, partial [bacterium]
MIDAGRRFTGRIAEGRFLHTIILLHDNLNHWRSDCSCRDGSLCVHSLTLLSLLLDVNDLNDLPAPNFHPAAANAHAQPPVALTRNTLVSQVTDRLQRKLTTAETRLLLTLEAMHRTVRDGYTVSVTRIRDLGVSVAFDKLEAWTDLRTLAPVDCDDTLVWWGNVAAALTPHKLVMPQFLAMLTDLTAAKARLRQWQRASLVQKWHQTLQTSIRSFSPNAARQPTQVTDLRLGIHPPTSICLEGRQAATGEYRPLTTKILKHLHEDGLPSAWPPEALILWSTFFSHHVYTGYTHAANYSLNDHGARRALVDVLRLPSLASRIVDANGEMLTRPTEKLRWELTPVSTPDEDYALHLVLPDGKPVTQILATFHAHPLNYYLTPTAIYQGPRAPTGMDGLAQLQAIPAPAIESPAGAQWLQALDVPLPPRLAARVRHETAQVTIRCALHRNHTYNRTEMCSFRINSASPDGSHMERWLNRETGWRAEQTPTLPKDEPPASSDSPIRLYDQSPQQAAVAFLHELDVRWSQEYDGVAARVTKVFPDRFAAWLRRAPPHVQILLDGELASLAQADIAGQIRLDVSEADVDWFDLRVVVDVSDTTLSPEEIKLLLAAHGGFVRLPNKGWRRMAFNLSDEEQESLARLGLSPRELDAEPQRLHALQLADATSRRMLPTAQAERVERRAAEIRLRATPEIPAGITAQLRPYQIDGFHFLAYLAVNHFGGILADDMGLGKTLQALTWLLWLRAEAGKEPGAVLIVCPKSVTDNWLAEAARFAPALRVRIWHGGEAAAGLATPAVADVHVINYNQLRLAEESVCSADWLAVVLDEGQYIKNPSSQVSQIARRMRARHRLVLTGTPIENRLLDLWSLLSFAMPGALGTRAQFGRTFDAKGDPFSRRRLAARVRPFLLRRTKDQVASDLPPRVEEDLFCELEGHQLALYQAERKRAQQLLLGIQSDKQLSEQRFNI